MDTTSSWFNVYGVIRGRGHLIRRDLKNYSIWEDHGHRDTSTETNNHDILAHEVDS
jgi:hypothetical protein